MPLFNSQSSREYKSDEGFDSQCACQIYKKKDAVFCLFLKWQNKCKIFDEVKVTIVISEERG